MGCHTYEIISRVPSETTQDIPTPLGSSIHDITTDRVPDVMCGVSIHGFDVTRWCRAVATRPEVGKCHCTMRGLETLNELFLHPTLSDSTGCCESHVKFMKRMTGQYWDLTACKTCTRSQAYGDILDFIATKMLKDFTEVHDQLHRESVLKNVSSSDGDATSSAQPDTEPLFLGDYELETAEERKDVLRVLIEAQLTRLRAILRTIPVTAISEFNSRDYAAEGSVIFSVKESKRGKKKR